jgi:hypothetical protein
MVLCSGITGYLGWTMRSRGEIVGGGRSRSMRSLDRAVARMRQRIENREAHAAAAQTATQRRAAK